MDRQARLCPVCHQSAIYLKRVDHYLSLFFIPLFPVKKGTPFLSCDNCHSVFDEGGTLVEEVRKRPAMTCPYCGRRLEEDFDYCPSCGNRITSS